VPITEVVVDGIDNEPDDGDAEDRRAKPSEVKPDKPISFDFKLRLGSRESTAALSGRATGELVQLQPIDWDSFTGLRDDHEPREYKTDGDLPSIIVELANQIAGPDTLANAAMRVNELAHANGDVEANDHLETELDDHVETESHDHVGAAEQSVVTVDDDPALSAVVGQILDAEPTVSAIETGSEDSGQAIAPPSEDSAAPPTDDRGVLSPDSNLSVGPAVRAPAQPVPEGPIELPRILALTPEPTSGEVQQSPVLTPSTPTPAVAAASGTLSPPAVKFYSGRQTVVPGSKAPVLTATPDPFAAPLAPLQLAKIERRPNAERPSMPVDFHALLGEAGLQVNSPGRKKKTRHPFRMMFKLIVVLGIIGGGLFYGKKYVLDMRWDKSLEPYAEAVSDARELSWKKPIEVRTLPLGDYAERLVATVFGPQVNGADLGAEWRAMGLLEGELDFDVVGRYVGGWRPVLYDPTDETIYELEDLPNDLRDFYLYQALSVALLDQNFSWSSGLEMVGPAERVGRLALIEADAGATTWEIVDPDDDDLREIGRDRDDLQDDIGEPIGGASDYVSDLVRGPGDEARGLFGDDVITDVAERDRIVEASVASDAAVLDGLRGLSDRPVDLGDVSRSVGMVYWYYVLAGRMSDADAWNAAVAWDGDLTRFESTATGNCVSATISVIDEPGRLLLLGALQRWAAAAPPASLATVAELGTERIEVRSCDPGTEADTKKDDGIDSWGLANQEYSSTLDMSLERDGAARSCMINALRNFGVLAQTEAGDVAGAAAATEGIRTSCESG
jgi:hypothetical protein